MYEHLLPALNSVYKSERVEAEQLKALLDCDLIGVVSDNPPDYTVTGRGLAFLAAHGYPIEARGNVSRPRLQRPAKGLRGNPYANKRAG